RRALIGIGFQERSEAFDFQVTLQDHIKHLKAEKEAIEHAKTSALVPKKDYSLKEGQTISINLGHQKSRHSKSQSIDHVPISEETGGHKRSPSPSNDFGEFKGFEDSFDKINIVNNADSVIEDSSNANNADKVIEDSSNVNNTDSVIEDSSNEKTSIQ
ncbi:16613_t:CDS:2, partial [Dentiscutata heterogama]